MHAIEMMFAERDLARYGHRTSDIELTLVVGVHGPQTVHVLLLEDV